MGVVLLSSVYCQLWLLYVDYTCIFIKCSVLVLWNFLYRAGSGYMPFGPLNNGSGHKGGVSSHGGLTPSRGVPLTGFPSNPLTQPYAIPSRGGIHGPIGGGPQGPQSGSRGFGAGRGTTNGPIGGHLSHHQASQQQGSLGVFGFGGLEGPATQASLGGPMTQQGMINQVCQSLAFGAMGVSRTVYYKLQK